jgi:UDP-glucose 4-epimerase
MLTGPVLVTGAGGWIGSLIVGRLQDDGAPGAIVAPDRDELDLAEARQVEAFLARERPRTVLHLASSTARDGAPSSVTAQWRDTFLAGRNVVEASASAGVRHLIMAGTMEEMGDQPGVLGTDLPAQPRTAHGLCKTLVREVAAFESRRAPIRVDWIRPTTVYGPGQRGPMLVPSACAAAVSGRPAPFTAGVQQRDFLFVEDLLDWILLALDGELSDQGDLGFHLHHLGTGVGVTVRQVLDLIASELPGARFHLGAIPRREHEPLVQIAPTYHSPDPALASWTARTGWEVGIRITTDWWRTAHAVPPPP